jgi:hypothetical protein
MRILGIVTIGQAPRDDIVELFATQAPAGTRVILRGALDGLSDAEVDALPPRDGADTLYTRLRGGRDVKISKQAVIARSPATLAKLRADGCDAIVYACTGEFPAMEGDAGVLFPSRVLSGIAEGLLPRGRRTGREARRQMGAQRRVRHSRGAGAERRTGRSGRGRAPAGIDETRPRGTRLHELRACHQGGGEGRSEGADPARHHCHRACPARAARLNPRTS